MAHPNANSKDGLTRADLLELEAGVIGIGTPKSVSLGSLPLGLERKSAELASKGSRNAGRHC